MKKIKTYEQLCLFVGGLQESHCGTAIILYDLGSYFVVVGEAAVTLYKKFGWDFMEAHELDRQNDKLFSLVSADGYVCLKRNGIEFSVRNTGFQLVADCISVYTETQQFLETVRSYLVGEEVYTYPFIRENVVLNTVDYQRTARITSLIISKEAVKVEIDNNDVFDLARNMEWDFTQVSITLIRALHNIITRQHDFMKSFAVDRDFTEKEVRRLNTFIHLLAEHHKVFNPEEIVLVKQRGYFISFDDDAIVIANRLSVPLYECRTFGTRNHTAVIITPNEFKALTDMDVNIHCIATDINRNMFEFNLSYDALLNLSYDKSITYDEVAVMKNVSGNYFIKASYGGKKLAPVTIPNRIGIYLRNLTDYSLEYHQMLSCLVHKTYDKQILMLENQFRNNEEHL